MIAELAPVSYTHLDVYKRQPVKDMAFRELSFPVADIDRRLAVRLRANNRVRQFSLAAASYFADASKVPREFREAFSIELNTLIDGS